jgi:hypothetical protein
MQIAERFDAIANYLNSHPVDAIVWVQMDARISEADRNFKVVLEHIRVQTRAVKLLFVNGKGGWNVFKPNAKSEYAINLKKVWKDENEQYYKFTNADPWVSISQHDFMDDNSSFLNRTQFLQGLVGLGGGGCLSSVPCMSHIIAEQKALFLDPEKTYNDFVNQLNSEISSLESTISWRREHITKMKKAMIGMTVGSWIPFVGYACAATNVGLAIGIATNEGILSNEEKSLGEKKQEKSAGEPGLRMKVEEAAKRWNGMASYLRVSDHGIHPSFLSA